jgi:hypothetical protein
MYCTRCRGLGFAALLAWVLRRTECRSWPKYRNVPCRRLRSILPTTLQAIAAAKQQAASQSSSSLLGWPARSGRPMRRATRPARRPRSPRATSFRFVCWAGASLLGRGADALPTDAATGAQQARTRRTDPSKHAWMALVGPDGVQAAWGGRGQAPDVLTLAAPPGCCRALLDTYRSPVTTHSDKMVFRVTALAGCTGSGGSSCAGEGEETEAGS